jgi:hypothetical protein
MQRKLQEQTIALAAAAAAAAAAVAAIAAAATAAARPPFVNQSGGALPSLFSVNKRPHQTTFQ